MNGTNIQESYVKYGIDLAPETEERPKKAPAREPAVKISAKEKGQYSSGDHGDRHMLYRRHIHAGVRFQHKLQRIFSESRRSAYWKAISTICTFSSNSSAALDYVESYATENLGMIYPGSDQYVNVSDMEGSAEVESYIVRDLTAQQKGVSAAADTEHSVSGAARRLLSGPSAS